MARSGRSFPFKALTRTPISAQPNSGSFVPGPFTMNAGELAGISAVFLPAAFTLSGTEASIGAAASFQMGIFVLSATGQEPFNESGTFQMDVFVLGGTVQEPYQATANPLQLGAFTFSGQGTELPKASGSFVLGAFTLSASVTATGILLAQNRISQKQFWIAIRFYPIWAYNAAPIAAPYVVSAFNTKVYCYYDRPSLNWTVERDDAGGSGASAVVAGSHGANAPVVLFIGGTPAQIAIALGSAAFTTAVNSKNPVITGTNFFVADDGSGAHSLSSIIKWVAGGVGTYTSLDRTKAYWSSDNDLAVPTINVDSPGAGCTFVWNFDQGMLGDLSLAPNAVLTQISDVSATIAITNSPGASVPTAHPTLNSGMNLIYYRANNRYMFTLSGLKGNTSGILLDPTNVATAYVTITNLVTGASYMGQSVMTPGSANSGSFTITTPSTATPVVGPILVSASVYDQQGSSGTLYGTIEEQFILAPTTQLLYRRNSSNYVSITNVVDASGNPLTSSGVTFFVTLTNAYTQAIILATTACAYYSSGSWYISIPPFAGEPVITMTVDIFDSTGLSGTRRGQYVYTLYRG